MGHGKKHTFCAEDTPFVTGKATNVEWKPTCRDNSKDYGNSFLGTVLNADPIGNAKFVIDQVCILYVKKSYLRNHDLLYSKNQH